MTWNMVLVYICDHLKSMYILLLCYRVFYKCHLSMTGWWCWVLLYPCWYYDLLFYQSLGGGHWSLWVKLQIFLFFFPFSFISVYFLHISHLCCLVHIYLKLIGVFLYSLSLYNFSSLTGNIHCSDAYLSDINIAFLHYFD